MRLPSIDLLRTFAIVMMVLVHFLENLSGVDWAPAGLGAPLFAFLAGLSAHLRTRSLEAKGTSDAVILRTSVRRGLFVCVLGVVFNVLVWLPPDTFNWDVLTMTGTALVLLPYLRKLPPVVVATIAVAVFVLAPVLREQADYNSYWPNNNFEPDLTLPDILVGYLATGYFPLFPWLVFPLAGHLVGVYAFRDDLTARPSVRPLLLVGVGLLLLAGLMHIGHFTLGEPFSKRLLIGWHMFPASPEYVAGALGTAVLLFGMLHDLIDRRCRITRPEWLLPMAKRLSTHSLTLYLIHHALHLWPLWVAGWATADDTIDYWRNALPVWASLALVPVCLGVCYLYLLAADRWKWPTAESLMRWVCD